MSTAPTPLPRFTIHNTANDPAAKPSVLYMGPSYTGKTEYLLSYPKLLVIYSDLNEGTLQKHPDIQYIRVRSFSEIRDKLCPAIANREIDADSIGWDSITQSQIECVREVQGDKPSMAQADWGLVLAKMETAITILTSSAKPTPNHPGYNVVGTVLEQNKTNSDGAIIKTLPLLQGQIQDRLAGMFSTTLWTVKRTTTQTVEGKVVRVPEYVCMSVPPTPQHVPAGDRIGGGLGKTRYKALPPVMQDGTYTTLCKHWGLE